MSDQEAIGSGLATAVPAIRRRAPSMARLGIGALLLCVAVLVAALAVDDVRTHRQAAQEARRAADLSRRLGAATTTIGRLDGQLADLRTENAGLQDEARNPTLAMWNSCGGPCTIGPNSVRVGSVPDTFELQITFTSDVPVRTYFFTFHQWTQFDGCGFSARCVSGGYTALDATTALDQRFSEAEGCSGYVWVLQADRDGAIRPDVRIHYLPADRPTGVCAVNP